LRDSEQLIFGGAELVRKPDIFRRFFEKAGKQFAPGAEQLFAEIFSFKKQQIKDVLDKQYTSGAFEVLEELERRPALLIECGRFAIEDHVFSRQ
jgi:hypothetical protein